jgi:membrane carboxypeptidase/penicillin-binding protein PbpC
MMLAATPATVLADVRTSFPSADGFYRPENYNRRCYGPVRYRTALASSLNIPAVKVLLDAGGPAALHERLRECGLTTLHRPAEVYGLGLTLGPFDQQRARLADGRGDLAHGVVNARRRLRLHDRDELEAGLLRVRLGPVRLRDREIGHGLLHEARYRPRQTPA